MVRTVTPRKSSFWLVIVITGVYSAEEYKSLVVNEEGAALTSQALKSVSTIFPYILCLAVMLFAYSTMISWSYYGERCWRRGRCLALPALQPPGGCGGRNELA